MRGQAEQGMTLVEMLVVLAIIAVAAGAVTLGIGAATRAPNVETEARRLASRIQAASDDAMLGDRMVALTARRDGYGFAVNDGSGWLPRTDGALGYHRLPAGIVVTLDQRPPIILGIDGGRNSLSATIANGATRWRVLYDGMTAIARPAPGA